MGWKRPLLLFIDSSQILITGTWCQGLCGLGGVDSPKPALLRCVHSIHWQLTPAPAGASDRSALGILDICHKSQSLPGQSPGTPLSFPSKGSMRCMPGGRALSILVKGQQLSKLPFLFRCCLWHFPLCCKNNYRKDVEIPPGHIKPSPSPANLLPQPPALQQTENSSSHRRDPSQSSL